MFVWASRTKYHLVPTWDSESFGEFWHEAWGFGEVVQDWMSEQGWYSDWEDTEVCFQFIFVCIKSPLQAFYVHMSDTCRTLSNQLFWNSVLQQKVGKIHFDCSQTCFEEELNLRLKGGPVIVRKRQKLTSRFIFLFARCFQTNVAKDKQEFSPCFILCRVLLRDAVRCSVCAQRRTIWKVTVPITKVMAVWHFVSRSRLIAPKSLATV